jgi:hypothetical protein
MLGSPLYLIMDSDFSLFSELLGLVKLTYTSNLSLDTMLDCTSGLVLVLSTILQ